MTNIVVVGSLNMDLVVQVPTIPKPGETVLGNNFATYPGGKGANQAVAAARLGASVTMIGQVGADTAGAAGDENSLTFIFALIVFHFFSFISSCQVNRGPSSRVVVGL